ncbi:MAG: winged helix-turn-helix domain-containing protein [Pseudomonadota bacterium]
MKEGPNIARIAALIGDPARANILSALMAGKALTASELAEEAGVTPQTASSHLAKLEAGALVEPRKQGRHKYFALASDDVAALLESLDGVAAARGLTRTRTGPRDPALRDCRVCYNHLAGHRAVAMFDGMLAAGHLDRSAGLSLTPSGAEFVAELGVDLADYRSGQFVTECLDWSERRSHLGGWLSRALFSRFEDMAWLRRSAGTRLVHFTPDGLRQFHRVFRA